jgi:hypothetical protein
VLGGSFKSSAFLVYFRTKNSAKTGREVPTTTNAVKSEGKETKKIRKQRKKREKKNAKTKHETKKLVDGR